MGDGVCIDEVLTKTQQVINETVSHRTDMVNRPPHYTQGNIECIDAIEASMTPEEFSGFLKGQVLRYNWRYEKKWDPVEDLEKAEFYLNRLIEHTKKHPDIFQRDYSLTVQPTQKLDVPRDVAESMKEALDNIYKIHIHGDDVEMCD